MNLTSLSEWRCTELRPDGRRCNNLLARVKIAPGSIVVIKCPRCGASHTYDGGAFPVQEIVDEVMERITQGLSASTRPA